MEYDDPTMFDYLMQTRLGWSQQMEKLHGDTFLRHVFDNRFLIENFYLSYCYVLF